MPDQRLTKLAETIRTACLEAALEAYEDAGLSGLCHEGRWECAVGAIKGVNVEKIVRQMAAQKATPADKQ